jgi:hypothetical protein
MKPSPHVGRVGAIRQSYRLPYLAASRWRGSRHQFGDWYEQQSTWMTSPNINAVSFPLPPIGINASNTKRAPPLSLNYLQLIVTALLEHCRNGLTKNCNANHRYALHVERMFEVMIVVVFKPSSGIFFTLDCCCKNTHHSSELVKGVPLTSPASCGAGPLACSQTLRVPRRPESLPAQDPRH